MADPHRIYEVRCPVHGFITISDWEREIIALRPFQRLRRIRQLAWTDQVYPGAMHTRFEHSLGVMHTATLLYDSVVQRSREVLGRELGYIEAGLERHRALVRLAALLHDVGHGPFSHASEDLFPEQGPGLGRFKHEHYSAAIVRRYFSDVIKNHPLNANYDFNADQVADLLEGKSAAGRALFWRELIDGQMDADRMDYLLRDSLHAGVQYGRFDLQRLVRSIVVVPPRDDEPEGAPRLGVGEGGWHAAESLILARYFMFTQVYYHKTRVAYNYHLEQALGEILPDGLFPSPLGQHLDDYLRWDDWRVLGLLADDGGGEHGRRLATRDHFREVFHTPEIPSEADLARLDRVRAALGDLPAVEIPSSRSWYKLQAEDIPVVSDNPGRGVQPLSNYSAIVANLRPSRQVRLYCRPEDSDRARESIRGVSS